jgi:hypothetical protein
MNSNENIKNVICDISTELKQSIMNILIPLKNTFKIPVNEIDKYLPILISTNGKQMIEDSLNNYYKNNKIEKKLYIPVKYNLQIFKNKNNKEDNNIINNNKNNKNESLSLLNKENQILVIEDGYNEMKFMNDEIALLTSKKMFNNFKLINNLGFNLDIEEEKNTTMKLTMKIIFYFKKEKKIINKDKKYDKNNRENNYNIDESKLLNLNKEEIINITEEEIKLFELLLDKHHNRVIFFYKLDVFRSTGKLLIPKKEYEIMINIFNLTLNKVKRDNDIHCGKNVILLSQTYYTLENDKKIYLQAGILNNQIFKNDKFWEDLLDMEITREFQKLVKIQENNLNIKNNNEANKKQFENIIFGQIITICNNMISFQINKEKIYQLINPKIKGYQLSQDIVDNIKIMIDNMLNEEKIENHKDK